MIGWKKRLIVRSEWLSLKILMICNAYINNLSYRCKERYNIERKTERERQRDRKTETDRQRQTGRQTETERQIGRGKRGEKGRHWGTHIDWRKHRITNIQTKTHTNIFIPLLRKKRLRRTTSPSFGLLWSIAHQCMAGLQAHQDVQVALNSGHKELHGVHRLVRVLPLDHWVDGLEQTLHLVIGEQVGILSTDQQAVEGIKVAWIFQVTGLRGNGRRNRHNCESDRGLNQIMPGLQYMKI